jgi:hypothetical protein
MTHLKNSKKFGKILFLIGLLFVAIYFALFATSMNILNKFPFIFILAIVGVIVAYIGLSMWTNKIIGPPY